MENITLGEISIAIAFVVAMWRGFDYLIEKVKAPQKEQQKQIDFIFKFTFALLEHEITGDHVNDMEELYKEAKEFLITNK